MKLQVEQIGGMKVQIEVDGSGSFFAEVEDAVYQAKTLDELKEKLRKAIKKATQQGTVDVTVIGLIPNTEKGHMYGRSEPFTKGIGVIQAKLRAKHERQYNTFLLVSEERQKFQIEGSNRATIARRLTEAEVADYLRLAEDQRAATAALEDWIGAVKIDPDEALKAAYAGDLP